MTECDHSDHDLVSDLRDLLYVTERKGLTIAETMQEMAELDVLGVVTGMRDDLEEIRATLDASEKMDAVKAVDYLVERHEKLQDSLEGLLCKRGDDTLDVIDELLDDVAEMVKLLDPILGGFSDTDDMDTITMRVLVDRISRKLLGR